MNHSHDCCVQSGNTNARLIIKWGGIIVEFPQSLSLDMSIHGLCVTQHRVSIVITRVVQTVSGITSLETSCDHALFRANPETLLEHARCVPAVLTFTRRIHALCITELIEML